MALRGGKCTSGGLMVPLGSARYRKIPAAVERYRGAVQNAHSGLGEPLADANSSEKEPCSMSGEIGQGRTRRHTLVGRRPRMVRPTAGRKGLPFGTPASDFFFDTPEVRRKTLNGGACSTKDRAAPSAPWLWLDRFCTRLAANVRGLCPSSVRSCRSAAHASRRNRGRQGEAIRGRMVRPWAATRSAASGPTSLCCLEFPRPDC